MNGAGGRAEAAADRGTQVSTDLIFVAEVGRAVFSHLLLPRYVMPTWSSDQQPEDGSPVASCAARTRRRRASGPGRPGASPPLLGAPGSASGARPRCRTRGDGSGLALPSGHLRSPARPAMVLRPPTVAVPTQATFWCGCLESEEARRAVVREEFPQKPSLFTTTHIGISWAPRVTLWRPA